MRLGSGFDAHTEIAEPQCRVVGRQAHVLLLRSWEADTIQIECAFAVHSQTARHTPTKGKEFKVGDAT